MPTIVALVKNVPDTWSTRTLSDDHTLDRESVDTVLDEVNEVSVEVALRLRDDNPDRGFRVVALTMGPAEADESLRKALAMGADHAVHLKDDALAGSDVLGTTWALHNAINALAAEDEIALIIAGNAASDGAMGALAGTLAEYRQVPALTNVVAVGLNGDAIEGTRHTPAGTHRLRAPLPAVVSVTEKAEKPRFPNFKGLMAAKKHELTVYSLAEIGVAAEQVGRAHAATAVTAAEVQPERTSGTIVYGDDKAGDIADFLAENKFFANS